MTQYFRLANGDLGLDEGYIGYTGEKLTFQEFRDIIFKIYNELWTEERKERFREQHDLVTMDDVKVELLKDERFFEVKEDYGAKFNLDVWVYGQGKRDRIEPKWVY